MSWKWNFVINVLGKGGTVLVAFVFTPVFVRLLGLEAWALVAFFMTFLSMTFVLDFAFGATMTREMARYSLRPDLADQARDLARSLEFLYLYIGIAMAIAGYFASPWIAVHWLNLQALPVGMVQTSVTLMCFAIALQVPLGMYSGGMYGLERQPALNLAQFSMSVLRYGGATVVLLWFGATPVVFFTWQLIFSLLQTLTLRSLMWHYMPRGERPARFNLAALREVSHFTSRVTGTAVSSFVINQLDKVVLSKLMPLAALGSYQLGSQVSNATRLAATLIETVVMPRMVIHVTRNDQPALHALYHESCQMVALITLPLAAAIVFFGEPLIAFWLGDIAMARIVAPITVILTLGMALNAMMRVPAGVTLAKGWASFGLWESLISGSAFVPALIVLVHLYGAIGAASTWLILNIFSALICAPIIHARMLPGELKTWFVWSAAIPSLLAFGLFAIAREVLPPSSPATGTAIAAGTWVFVSSVCMFAMPRTRAIAIGAARRLLSLA